MIAGVELGLALTAFGLGFRHGIDWDHLAALTDITGSRQRGRRSMWLATMYAVGHALMVFSLGVLAIVASAEVPTWLDGVMGRVVGVTLLALAISMLVSLARRGRDFRIRSRWMLAFAGIRRVRRWIASLRAPARDVVVVTHAHDHDHVNGRGHAHDHAHADARLRDSRHSPAAERGGVATVAPHRHAHLHHHLGSLPDDPFPSYGTATAFGVGVLHGVGAETPTQILVFLAAARAGGAAAGVLLLLCFVVGLVASNTAVAITASLGLLGASRNFAVYATLSVVVAAFSLVVGSLFLLGRAPMLPSILGG